MKIDWNIPFQVTQIQCHISQNLGALNLWGTLYALSHLIIVSTLWSMINPIFLLRKLRHKVTQQVGNQRQYCSPANRISLPCSLDSGTGLIMGYQKLLLQIYSDTSLSCQWLHQFWYWNNWANIWPFEFGHSPGLWMTPPFPHRFPISPVQNIVPVAHVVGAPLSASPQGPDVWFCTVLVPTTMRTPSKAMSPISIPPPVLPSAVS